MQRERRTIPIDQIAPHPKNREYFRDLSPDELADLKQSIVEHGLIYCPIVCPDGNGGYVILCGHQRLAAAKELGWKELEVEIQDTEPHSVEAEMLLITENLQRRQLSHTEIKKAALRLLELGRKKTEVAEALGVDRKTLNTTLAEDRIIPPLRKMLPKSVWAQVAEWPQELQRTLHDNLSKEIQARESAVQYEIQQKLKQLDETAKANLRRATDAERRLKSLENILEKKRQAIEAMNAEKAELQARLQALEDESPDNSEEIEALQEQLNKIQETLDQERQERKTIELMMEKLEAEHQRKLADFEAQMEQAVEQARIEAERKARKELEAHIQQQTEHIQAAQAENAQLKEKLGCLEEQMREITKKPIPVLITQYLSSCLMADRMGEIFAGQLREIEITIEGKSKDDPDSFQAIPKTQVLIWITRLRNLGELCNRLADQYEIWHKIKQDKDQ
jgi:ParB/RepB/Spo0J family partition protein